MKSLFSIISVCLMLTTFGQQQTFYQETYRPQYHFTPAIHWMNDPNGLVYHKGEYHLFYQFNPFGNRWGHMSWGHAISKDLLHWQHLPVAIPEEKDTMIFSGSCVVDMHNSSGFAKQPGQVPMVAIYTAHIEGLNQSQHIAYSLDDGRSWTKYQENPVLDLGKKDFRDPKVFWYDAGKKWVMAVALPIEKQIQLYQSTDLKKWEWMSNFGPAGDTSGIWECPDLFEVPVEGQPGKTKWVLMHSPAPYMQYFVGEFDGKTFLQEKNQPAILRPDYGPDYYAAIVFNQLPNGRKPVSIGWVNNWNYANDIPTTPWKSAMSLPRELTLKSGNEGWILMQKPIPQLSAVRGKAHAWNNLKTGKEKQLPINSQQLEMKISLTPFANSISGIRLAKGNGHFIEVGYDDKRKVLYIDRAPAGDSSFHSSFGKLSRYETALKKTNGSIQLHLFLDRSVLEVFANDGEVAMTSQLFPSPNNNAVSLFSSSDQTIFNKINGWEIKSVWR